MKSAWVVQEGVYYHDLYTVAFVCRVKKTALLVCKRDGYKYNKEQDLYLHETKRRWRRLERAQWEEG